MTGIPGPDALSAAGLPPVSEALLPASVRNGPAAAKSAYETGLGFEDVLVGELAQEMMASAGPGQADPNGVDGSGASDPMTGPYSGLLGQALTSGIMSAGGLGIARQIATALDPSITAGP